jgi:zinc/manganese transport system permease protein
VDLLHVLFGTVLALDDAALALLWGITAVTLATLFVIRRPLILDCLDPGFLRQVSGLGAVAHYGFLALLVINLVAGFHALGTLMAVGIMVLPAASARFWVRRLGTLVAVATSIALFTAITGLLVSYHADWPTSPVIVLGLGTVYLLSMAFAPRGVLRQRIVSPRHLRA